MKQTIRAFAIGLLSAGAVIAAVFYLYERDDSAADKTMSHDEMAEQLKTQGYRIVTEEEYISLKVNKAKALEEQKAASDKKTAETPNSKPKKEQEKALQKKEQDEQQKEKQKEKQEDGRTFTIQIASGMKTAEISEMLADNGIIKDARKFDDFLEKNGYASKIQIGKHKLSSSMSDAEIAKTLTK